MSNSKILGLLCLLAFFGRPPLYAQSTRDTVSWIHEFRQAISLAERPEVYLGSETRLASTPVLERDDTFRLAGKLYQFPGYYYSSDGREETFWQDGLLIRVNHATQSILLRRIDSATWSKAGRQWKGQKPFEAALSKDYRIAKLADADGVRYEAQPLHPFPGAPAMTIRLSCSADGLPRQLALEATLEAPASEAAIAQIDAAGYARSSLVVTSGDRSVIRRSQSLTVRFVSIAFERPKDLVLPDWRRLVAYDAPTDTYSGTGACTGYTVTQTF